MDPIEEAKIVEEKNSGLETFVMLVFVALVFGLFVYAIAGIIKNPVSVGKVSLALRSEKSAGVTILQNYKFLIWPFIAEKTPKHSDADYKINALFSKAAIEESVLENDSTKTNAEDWILSSSLEKSVAEDVENILFDNSFLFKEYRYYIENIVFGCNAVAYESVEDKTCRRMIYAIKKDIRRFRTSNGTAFYERNFLSSLRNFFEHKYYDELAIIIAMYKSPCPIVSEYSENPNAIKGNPFHEDFAKEIIKNDKKKKERSKVQNKTNLKTEEVYEEKSEDFEMPELETETVNENETHEDFELPKMEGKL